MKKIIISSLVMLMILTGQQIWAQPSPSDKIDRLKTELELNDDQVTQLEEIFESRHDEMKSLRSSDEMNQEEKRAAMQNFRTTMEKEIAGVLNEEQLAKFQEIKKERNGERGKRGDKKAHHKHLKDGKGKELHAEIKAYKDANIKPVMLEQRAKLERKISKKDKKLIAEMRVEFEKMKSDRKARFGEKGKDGKSRQGQDFKQKNQNESGNIKDEKREQVKVLVEKYRNDIEPLFAEISGQQENWEKDIKAIAEKYHKTDSDGKKMERRSNHMHGDRGEMKKMGRFLLLDPNEKIVEANTQSKVVKINAFPNPASSVTTLEYELLEDGKVLIELRDNKGNLLKMVKDTFLEKGTHQVTISLETYKNELFYIVVKDKNGISTTKEIVRVK